MLSTPRPESFLTLLATASIGAVWVGLNPRFRIEEMRFVLADCGPRVLFALAEFEDRDYGPDLGSLLSDFPGMRLVTLGDTNLPSARYEGLIALGGDVGRAGTPTVAMRPPPQDPALIVYTSGSTGKPKGALLTHYGLVHSYVGQLKHISSGPMVDVCNLPINHIGCLDLCCMPLISGGTIHFMERFDAEAMLELVESERVTFLGQVPTMYQMLAACPRFETANLSSLETVTWSGSAMPPGLIEIFRSRTKARLLVTYGLTESIAAITYSDPDADVETLATTIGKPDHRLQIRLVSSDGKECKAGAEGEIQVRHDAGMAGYLNQADATAEAYTADGYLRTGDIAIARPDGNLCLVGRLREMFKSGGYNVYPREIELCLERHADVAMAAVVEVRDPTYHEVGHAFVVPKPGRTPRAEDLAAWCREHLANYKVPKRISVTHILPMLPVGKVDKQALRRLAETV
jgi:acyl-CoA synthetase (AMP-forming)/AMP-acid ligase II